MIPALKGKKIECYVGGARVLVGAVGEDDEVTDRDGHG